MPSGLSSTEGTHRTLGIASGGTNLGESFHPTCSQQLVTRTRACKYKYAQAASQPSSQENGQASSVESAAFFAAGFRTPSSRLRLWAFGCDRWLDHTYLRGDSPHIVSAYRISIVLVVVVYVQKMQTRRLYARKYSLRYNRSFEFNSTESHN